MSFFIYFYYDSKDTLLYIGKAVDVFSRWNNHNETWKKYVCKIGVYKCSDHAEMDILEKYFISKLPTKYNKASLSHGYTNLNLKLKEPTIYTLNEFYQQYNKTNDNKLITSVANQIIPITTQIIDAGNSIIETDGNINLYEEQILQLDLDRVYFKHNNMYLISQFSTLPKERRKKAKTH